jgi:hypothetical protein
MECVHTLKTVRRVNLQTAFTPRSLMLVLTKTHIQLLLMCKLVICVRLLTMASTPLSPMLLFLMFSQVRFLRPVAMATAPASSMPLSSEYQHYPLQIVRLVRLGRLLTINPAQLPPNFMLSALFIPY